MDFNLITGIGVILIGSMAGLLTGMFGVGGGFLITPAPMILLSIPGPQGPPPLLPQKPLPLKRPRNRNPEVSRSH